MRAIEPHVTLALLLGIVERMRVQERPDELAADIFESEFKMGVLEDRVMAAVISCRAHVDALLFGDFFRADQARGIAGTRGSDSGIEGMREGVAQRDARRGGFDQRIGRCVGRDGHWRGH